MPRLTQSLSSGVVIVRRDPATRQYRFLLLRAYRKWDFPKGLVEPGETPVEAARREVREETSLEKLDFKWGDGFLETPPYSNHKVARYYLAECAEGEVFLPVSPELGRPEHNEFRWVTYPDAEKLLPPRLKPILDWARKTIQSP